LRAKLDRLIGELSFQWNRSGAKYRADLIIRRESMSHNGAIALVFFKTGTIETHEQ
jgi:hypothetical protein